MERLRPAAKLFLGAVVLAALGMSGFTFARTGAPDTFNLGRTILLTGLVALALYFPLQFAPKTKWTLHTSVILAATLTCEPAVALIIAATGTVISQALQRKAVDEILFNAAHMVLQVTTGGLMLTSAGWRFDTLIFGRPELALLTAGVAIVMYAIEVGAVATIVALQTGQPALFIVRQIAEFDRVELISQYALGVLGAIVVGAYPWALPLLLVPVVAVYRSSKRHLQLREQASALAHQAFHDPLTQLPNRALFSDRLAHALARAGRRQSCIAVLFFDLDRFKDINDSLGHAAGDQLLMAVAERMQKHLRSGDTLARLGGDEFTILLEEIEDAREARRVAERIIEALQSPFIVKGHEITVTTSIGVALNDAGQHDPADLLRDADAAMYQAKAAGRARYALFDPSLNLQALERLELDRALRQAIERKEFRVYYQPTVELTTGRIVGVEALVRWQHPHRGLVAPAGFIPFAEETGLIRRIGRWVLEEACRQAKEWHEEHADDPPSVSVNLSPEELQHPDLVQEVAQILHRTGLPPASLILEVTEGMAMQDAKSPGATLSKLKHLGVRIAIDDFGTGYSSLAYLKRFPIDVLKIDRSFVHRLGEDGDDTAILHTIITLAKRLKLAVTVEGIETTEQAAQLRALGCEIGQGYYFGCPLAPEAVDHLFVRVA